MKASQSGWAVFRYVDFGGEENSVHIEYASEGEGVIEVWADDQKIAAAPIVNTSFSYTFASSKIISVSGIRTLYLQWRLSSGEMKLRNLRFE